MSENVCSNCHLIDRMIADELRVNSERVWMMIMEDLKMRKISAKMVPRLLNHEQKEHHVQVCQDFLKELATEPDRLSIVVTGDKSQIFEYNPLTRQQSLEYHQGPKK